MKDFDEKAVIGRVRELRIRFAGERGKSNFARSLGISPSTYSYYEENRVPPIETLLAICQITGADLNWLLTGESTTASAGLPLSVQAKELTNRIAELLNKHSEMAEPVSAFVDLLCEKKGLEKQITPESNGTDSTKTGWIPVLGRTAAGIVHCWSDTTMPGSSEAVTKIEELVRQYTGKEIVGKSEVPVRVDFQLAELSSAISNTNVSLVRVSGTGRGQTVEFVDCEKISSVFPDCFALHVDGDSMSPRIKDGDIVIVSPSVPASDGQLAVARVADQIGVTCKLIRTTPKGVHLVPINEKYETKIVPHKDLLWAVCVLCHVNL
ncbi:MAG: S24 family peptidase [Phycisphaerae bacterium]|jgi:transcriptional regulator with XRE-family HTH domain